VATDETKGLGVGPVVGEKRVTKEVAQGVLALGVVAGRG